MLFRYTSELFRYRGNKFSSAATQLGLVPELILQYFEIQSRITGAVVPFNLVKAERDSNGKIVGYEYVSVGKYPTVFTAKIFVD